MLQFVDAFGGQTCGKKMRNQQSRRLTVRVHVSRLSTQVAFPFSAQLFEGKALVVCLWSV